MGTLKPLIVIIFSSIQVFPYVATSSSLLRNKDVKNDPPFPCTENGYYPIGECSEQYYICIDGNIYPQVCPPDSLFDPSVSACVSIDKLPACQTTTATPDPSITTTPGTTTTKPIECTQDGFFAFAECQPAYYICVSGVPYFQECPEGSVFVEAEASCKLIESTTCPVPTTTMKPFTCPDNNTGFYPVTPDACSGSYYTCFEGIPYPETCPEDSIFDVTVGGCVPPGSAACNQPAKLRERLGFRTL